MGIVSGIAFFVRALLSNRAVLAAEILALRHQLLIQYEPELLRCVLVVVPNRADARDILL